MSSKKSPYGHPKVTQIKNQDEEMSDDDSSLIQESLIEKLQAGMDEDTLKEVDPHNVRKDEVPDISKLPKIQEPSLIYSKWNNMRRFNINSDKEILNVMATKLYQQADDKTKVEWWMQLCKTLATDLWFEGEKIQKPDPATELVFRTVENYDGHDDIYYRNVNGDVDRIIRNPNRMLSPNTHMQSPNSVSQKQILLANQNPNRFQSQQHDFNQRLGQTPVYKSPEIFQNEVMQIYDELKKESSGVYMQHQQNKLIHQQQIPIQQQFEIIQESGGVQMQTTHNQSNYHQIQVLRDTDIQIENVLQMTSQQISQHQEQISFIQIIEQTRLQPRQLIKFLLINDEQKTLSQYVDKIKNLTQYKYPNDRNTTGMNPRFLEYQLIMQDRQEGGIAGCIKRIRERRSNDNLHIPKLEWIKEQWDLKLEMEKTMQQSIIADGLCCIICLSQKSRYSDLQEHYLNVHLWMIGNYADEQIRFPYKLDDVHYKENGIKPVWPDVVFWQFGMTSATIVIPTLFVEQEDNEDEESFYSRYKRQQQIYTDIFNSHPWSSANKPRFRSTKMGFYRNRSNFQTMEAYFNEVCEAYFLQTNGSDGYPTIGELATLYFDESDELKSVAYLIGSENGGADCMLSDEDIYLNKPTEQYAKPQVRLVEYQRDIKTMENVTRNMEKRERPHHDNTLVYELVNEQNIKNQKSKSNSRTRQRGKQVEINAGKFEQINVKDIAQSNQVIYKPKIQTEINLTKRQIEAQERNRTYNSNEHSKQSKELLDKINRRNIKGGKYKEEFCKQENVFDLQINKVDNQITEKIIPDTNYLDGVPIGTSKNQEALRRIQQNAEDTNDFYRTQALEAYEKMQCLAEEHNVKIKDRTLAIQLKKVQKSVYPLRDYRLRQDIDKLMMLVDIQKKKLAKIAKKEDDLYQDASDDIIQSQSESGGVQKQIINISNKLIKQQFENELQETLNDTELGQNNYLHLTEQGTTINHEQYIAAQNENLLQQTLNKTVEERHEIEQQNSEKMNDLLQEEDLNQNNKEDIVMQGDDDNDNNNANNQKSPAEAANNIKKKLILKNNELLIEEVKLQKVPSVNNQVGLDSLTTTTAQLATGIATGSNQGVQRRQNTEIVARVGEIINEEMSVSQQQQLQKIDNELKDFMIDISIQQDDTGKENPGLDSYANTGALLATGNANGIIEGLHPQHVEENINVKMSPAEAENIEVKNINNNENVEKKENITDAQQNLEVQSVNNQVGLDSLTNTGQLMATGNDNGSNQGVQRQQVGENIDMKMSPAEAAIKAYIFNEENNQNNKKEENNGDAQQTLEVPSVSNKVGLDSATGTAAQSTGIPCTTVTQGLQPLDPSLVYATLKDKKVEEMNSEEKQFLNQYVENLRKLYQPKQQQEEEQKGPSSQSQSKKKESGSKEPKTEGGRSNYTSIEEDADIFMKAGIDKSEDTTDLVGSSKAEIPTNLKLHCVRPAVSHLFYSKYLEEEDEEKRDLMLEINWTMKQKVNREINKKRDEKKRQKMIEKYQKEPEYVQEEYEGKLVIHNKPLEEWITVEQPIPDYFVKWNENGGDIVTRQQLDYLLKNHPIIDTKPQIFYDINKKKYVLWKDPRLPIFHPFSHIPPVQQRKLHICNLKLKNIKNGKVFLASMTWEQVQKFQQKKKEMKKEIQDQQNEWQKNQMRFQPDTSCFDKFRPFTACDRDDSVSLNSGYSAGNPRLQNQQIIDQQLKALNEEIEEKTKQLSKIRAKNIASTEFQLSKQEAEGVIAGGIEVKSTLASKKLHNKQRTEWTNNSLAESNIENNIVRKKQKVDPENEENMYSQYLQENQDGVHSKQEPMLLDSQSIVGGQITEKICSPVDGAVQPPNTKVALASFNIGKNSKNILKQQINIQSPAESLILKNINQDSLYQMNAALRDNKLLFLSYVKYIGKQISELKMKEYAFAQMKDGKKNAIAFHQREIQEIQFKLDASLNDLLKNSIFRFHKVMNFELMEFIQQKYLNFNSQTSDEDEDSDCNSIHKEVKAMKDLNDIDTEQQKKWWDQYQNNHQFQILDGNLDLQIGVNCEFGFHEQEEKWLPGEIDEAVKELKKWNWEDFRGRYSPTIYDICCGPGRCVKYYVDSFAYICLHDQSEEFVKNAAIEVSKLKSNPDLNIYKFPTFKSTERLDQITFPKSKVHFIFANYAFQNLRCSQLEPTMKKCLDNMEIGGIIFIKEPHPLDKKHNELDKQQQRILRPKKTYIDILISNGCIKIKELTHRYRWSPKQFGSEYILVFRKVGEPNVPQQ